MSSTVGIVSPGAMGSGLARALRRGGARVVGTLEGRSERTRGLAEAAKVELLPDLAAVLRVADVVLSVAPPDQAEAIAGEIARLAPPGLLVADLNAIAPATARRLAGLGLELVDGSISGPPPNRPGTTTIYLSGPRAEELAALPFDGVERRVVGPNVGTASAVKMCTASMYKGTVGLLVHALLTAHEHGVVDHVLDDVRETFPAFAENAPAILQRAAAKASRYVGEMHEIAATQAAAGLPAELFEGMAVVYEALAQGPAADRAPEDVDATADFDEVLDALQGRSRRGS